MAFIKKINQVKGGKKFTTREKESREIQNFNFNYKTFNLSKKNVNYV